MKLCAVVEINHKNCPAEMGCFADLAGVMPDHAKYVITTPCPYEAMEDSNYCCNHALSFKGK